MVTNVKKEVLWRWEGDAFGDVTPSIEKIKMPLRMAGQYKDDESGLFYNWHRYYIPELGRYNRVDPLGLYDGTNPFNYVGGSPLHYVDPFGLFTDSVTMTCARNPSFCAELGINTAGGVAAAIAMSRPSNMSKLEERAYDRYCNNDDDPCKALQAQTDKAIADAKTKMKDLLRDKDSLYGKQGWTNHTNNLKGRIAAIEAMISLGEKMGCNMFKQKMAAKRLGIPDAPKPWWRIF